MMVKYRKRLFQLYREKRFIITLSMKELRLKYSGSKLGVWWALILPLLLALSINLIFTKAFKVSIPNYTLFVLSVILPWLFFSQTVSEASNSFLKNISLLRQCIFLKEVIPLASVFGNFLNFSLGLIVIIPLFILFNPKILLLIPALILLLLFFLIFIAGLGLIFSLTNSFYRDVSCFLSLGLMIWFWITPVFYSIEMIPYPYKVICLVNPLTYFMISFRNLLYYGRMDLRFYSIDIIISIATFSIGYAIFVWKERGLLKRI